jgi:hypothetical protein
VVTKLRCCHGCWHALHMHGDQRPGHSDGCCLSSMSIILAGGLANGARWSAWGHGRSQLTHSPIWRSFRQQLRQAEYIKAGQGY